METSNLNLILKTRIANSNLIMVPILKACSHPQRYEILIELLDSEKKFSELSKKTKLSKTALSNHLQILIEADLIKKINIGIYQITPKSLEFFQTITTFYDRFMIESYQFDPIYREISQPKPNNSLTTKFLVSKPAQIGYGWISFNCCIQGVLESFGLKLEMSEIAGYSGYAFLININSEYLDAAGPTAYTKYVWDQILKGIESIGWQFEFHSEIGAFYPSTNRDYEDQLRTLRLFYWISDNIQNFNQPIILWGAPVPEYAIVNGVENQHYIISSFRRVLGLIDSPVRYDMLQSPGVLHCIKFVKSVEPLPSNERDKKAIERIIKFIETTPAVQGFTSGIDAYNVWIKHLESSINQNHIYHGNSYQGECLLELKSLATIFLECMGKRYLKKKYGSLLISAAKEYQEIVDIFKKFQQLFPFSMTGEMTKEKCTKGAKLLSIIPEYEKSALNFLKLALKNWTE